MTEWPPFRAWSRPTPPGSVASTGGDAAGDGITGLPGLRAEEQHQMIRRLVMAMALAGMLAACGGSCATRGGRGGTGGGPAAGNLNVSVGGTSKTYQITACVEASGTVTIAAGTPASDGVGLVIPNGSSVPATVAGNIGGKPFAGGADTKATYANKAGTFSGTDVASNGKIDGSFACK
jgi:hypothetical protein